MIEATLVVVDVKIIVVDVKIIVVDVVAVDPVHNPPSPPRPSSLLPIHNPPYPHIPSSQEEEQEKKKGEAPQKGNTPPVTTSHPLLPLPPSVVREDKREDHEKTLENEQETPHTLSTNHSLLPPKSKVGGVGWGEEREKR